MYGYTILCWVLVMPAPDVTSDLICMTSHEWYCPFFPLSLIITRCSCNRFYLNKFVITNLYSDLYMCGTSWCSSAKWWTSRSRRRSARYARTSQWRPGTLQPIRGQTDAFKACHWSDYPVVDLFATPLLPAVKSRSNEATIVLKNFYKTSQHCQLKHNCNRRHDQYRLLHQHHQSSFLWPSLISQTSSPPLSQSLFVTVSTIKTSVVIITITRSLLWSILRTMSSSQSSIFVKYIQVSWF